jgi:tetratricopeptide (TPR) repeat protein
MKDRRWKLGKVFAFAALLSFLILMAVTPRRAVPVARAMSAAEERDARVDAALFTRADFFGARAIVPIPTGEARARLSEVRKLYPQDSGIELKLAELDEKLGAEDRAAVEMARYVELEKDAAPALEKLADFYHRRARFADEAAARERMLVAAPRNGRAPVLRDLIQMARRYRLEKYQRPEFFSSLIASDPSSFEVVKEFVDHLTENHEFEDALKAVRQSKPSFPDQKDYFLEKEVGLLVSLNRGREAEALYVRSFDPFWPDKRSEAFYYEFLNGRDRLRAYGRELKSSFRRDPTNLDTAVRLFHYQHYDYAENDEASANIFSKLEQARASRGVIWTTEELATVSRLLIADRKIDPASRFLYTLSQQGGLERGGELRAKVLYELFRTLNDAGGEHTSLTAGDLKFYEDVANADPHPGMLGGALSLILADSNPRREFRQEEGLAVERFNRAAAFRIFEAYNREYPTSPEMAQMYSDLIRQYSKTGDANVAADLLAGFEKRHADAPQYAEVALNLADCYINYKNYAAERALYQRVMDRLGQDRGNGASRKPLMPVWEADGIDELTSRRPSTITYPPQNGGPDSVGEESEDGVGFSRAARFQAISLTRGKKSDAVDYALVLSRYVASLARENRAAEILALYSNEIKKYPDEQGLYEQLLQWLGQTNLVEEQLRVYQEAIQRFRTNTWTDRLARWYLRRDRKQAFEALANDLVGKMNDDEIEAWFAKFVNSGTGAKSPEFEANLYFALYTRARQRFPHNQRFVEGLLAYYRGHNRTEDWRRLAAEYYFESKEVRERYLLDLAGAGRLREQAERAREHAAASAGLAGGDRYGSLVYELFRADAAAWLSNYEEAVPAYRELDGLYPGTPEFAERLAAFTRSFGQKDQRALEESAAIHRRMADASPDSDAYRTQAGEVYAELGDYNRAREQWNQLIGLGPGDADIYLDTATVFWDYFQYDDALRTLAELRRAMGDRTLYAFQAAAILEAKHKTGEASGEYVKGLDPECPDYNRARRRLKALYGREGVPARLRAAFQRELPRSKDREALTLGYVELLDGLEKWGEAAPLLRREVARSRSQKFLDDARGLFRDHKDRGGEDAALRRLVLAARNARFAISYQLQLADRAAASGRKNAAAAALAQLVAKYPNNYGALSEAADVYWRMGMRDRAVTLLAGASRRGRGKFHYIFARKLAERQTDLGRLAAAEITLKALYDESPRNLDVFRALARIYVRASRPDALRERYRETIRAIKESDLDRDEARYVIDELRSDVIECFTQLKDYASAVEQHIEIINRDPDDQEKVDAALKYVRRYGGGEALIAYYTKASAEAYKDYRWALVLARIYESKGDWASSIANLRKAIDDQPEMVELHGELAEACLKAKDFKSAVAALERARQLSNDDPQFLRRLADAYEKAGRKVEADAARAKLPVEKSKAKSLSEQFAEASSLRGKEKAKAVDAYRKAFDAFASDYYKHELRPDELNGYVETLREGEPLDQILRRLWELRARVKRDAASGDNLLAGKARALVNTIDRALPQAVGNTAAEYATGEELAAIDRFARDRLAEAKNDDAGDDVSVVFLNLSQRAGLGQLAERVLIARKDRAMETVKNEAVYHERLMSLVNFYSERGAYQRIVELLDRERAREPWRDKFGYRQMIADYARLTDDRETELRVLREEFASRAGKPATTPDPLIERYFEALLERGAAGRDELRKCVQSRTPNRFQLITFLLRNEELKLAREAIDAAPESAVWKSSRQAEISLAARDLGPDNEAYFLRALGWRSVGEMVASKAESTARAQSQPASQLVGDNWFYLAEDYGRWLALAEKAGRSSTAASEIFLPAMTESRPKDAAAQSRLARWYAGQNAYQPAVDHFQLALAMNPNDARTLADTGSAYFKLGKRQEAEEYWAKIIAAGDARSAPAVDAMTLYLRALAGQGLADEARARLKPLIVKRHDAATDPDKELEALKPLVRALAKSFGKAAGKPDGNGSETAEAALSKKDEAEKAVFLRELCESMPGALALPSMVIEESLVDREHLAPFYETLINGSEGIPRHRSDSDFVDLTRRRSSWSLEEIEESLDRRRAGQTGAPADTDPQDGGRRVDWRRRYLDYLLAERRAAESLAVIPEIEREFKGRYPRPEWLRLAKLRLEIRRGHVAQALSGLRHFAGIETSPKLDRVAPPDLRRVNMAMEALRDEGRAADADELSRATHERGLALEQFQTASFDALARLAFNKGEAERGVKILKLMVELGATETRETAAAEIASLDWVKARAVGAEWVEKPEPSNQIQEAEALRIAAETSAEYDQFAFAVDCRRRLSSLSPEDDVNRLELARALAAGGKTDEGGRLLASLVSDRRVARRTRWTSVWIAPEVVKPDAWQSFEQQVRAGARNDPEILAAVDAQSLLVRAQSESAIERLDAAATAAVGPQFNFFRAIAQKGAGRRGPALRTLLESMIAPGDASVTAPFSSTEDEQGWQLVRLYAEQNSPRAALKLAAVDERLKGQSSVSAFRGGEEAQADNLKSGGASLPRRATVRQSRSQVELLTLLSRAAEQVGDMEMAIEYEIARLNSSHRANERRESESRVSQLKAKQRERDHRPRISVEFNESVVTAR